MGPVLLGIIGLILLLVLMMVRVPVAIAMTVVGLVGLTILNSWPAALASLVSEAWTVATFFELTVIPLFVLMGNVASICGMRLSLGALVSLP